MTAVTTALSLSLLMLLSLATAGSSTLHAQSDPPEPAPEPETAAGAAELPPIEAPPALSAMEGEKLKRSIKKLKNDSDKHRHLAEQEVIAFGRGALPLLEAAAVTDNEPMMDALVNCLCGIADARDRDRVEAGLSSPLPVLRRFAARKTGDIAQPALLDALLPLLDDADVLARVEAALSLVRNGREEGLAVATLAFGGSYGEGWTDRVLAALPGVAGKGTHEEVARLLVVDPDREKAEGDVASKERLAAVRLLHAIADRAATALIVRALDDRHNVVQREAINALRDLLEQQGPLEASSIFQQLNEVKRLKEVAAAKV